MTLRVAAAAALGALLLTGCAGPYAQAPEPWTVTQPRVADVCNAVKSGTTPPDYAAQLVPGTFPDMQTAEYEVGKRISIGCPEELTRYRHDVTQPAH